VKILTVFRIRTLVDRFVRRAVRRFVFVLVVAFLAGSFLVVRGVFLAGLKRQLGRSFEFKAVRLTYLPLELTVEDLRSLGNAPLIRVRRASVEMPYVSLFHRQKAVVVSIIEPEVRFMPVPKAPGRPAKPGRAAALSLPFRLKEVTVENGTVYYLGEKGIAELRGLDARLTTRGDEFELQAAAASGKLTVLPQGDEVGGRVEVLLSGKGEDVTISRLNVRGDDIDLRGRGRLRRFRDPELDIKTSFSVEFKPLADYLHIPFDLSGRTAGEGSVTRQAGRVTFFSSVASDGLTSGKLPLGSVRGDLEIKFGQGGSVDLGFRKNREPAGRLGINFGREGIKGRVEGMTLEPVMSFLRVPWPVRSPAWGAFSFSGGKLSVDAEFRDRELVESGGRFPLLGRAEVGVDFDRHVIDIRTADMQTSFARLEARADWHPGAEVEAEIRGSVSDLKRCREFLSLILNEKFEFPEIRGSGYASVRLNGPATSPRVSFSGAFSPAGFGLFDAAYVEGQGLIAGAGFSGRFKLDDPAYKGSLTVESGRGRTEVEFREAEGDLARVLAGLELDLPFKGRAAGDFRLALAGEKQDFEGEFRSPELEIAGFKTEDATGRVEWHTPVVSLTDLNFKSYGGPVAGRFRLDVGSMDYDISLQGEGLDLALLYPGRQGRFRFDASGTGRFGRDMLPVRFEVKDLVFPPIARADARGELGIDIRDAATVLDVRADIGAGDNKLEGSFRLPQADNSITGKVNGHFTDLDLVAPWKGARGRADFSLDVSGDRDEPKVASRVSFQGPVLPLPGFPYAVQDFSGSLLLEGGRVFLQEFKGTFGGGGLTASGEIGLGEKGVESLDLRAEGKDMQLAPFERVRAVLDGYMRLVKDSRQFVMEGDFLVRKMNWRRELLEKLEFGSSANGQTSSEPSFFDGLTLNLRFHSNGDALMDNSMGRLSGRFDLSVSGSLEDPIILGDIEVERGRINFQDQNFRVLGGRVSFFDPVSMDPYVDLRAEAFVKDYRITMNLSGLASRMRPEFTSSPPLPSEDVLALLALGESYQRLYSTERTTTLSSASLVSFQLAGQARKSTEGFFSLDRFRIDPFVSGSSSEMTARLTLGKKISKNVLFIYSTNLAASREEIYRLEWNVGYDFSLVTVRNDLGRMGFDLKLRKRF
jgi:hypothetical protein